MVMTVIRAQVVHRMLIDRRKKRALRVHRIDELKQSSATGKDSLQRPHHLSLALLFDICVHASSIDVISDCGWGPGGEVSEFLGVRLR